MTQPVFIGVGGTGQNVLAAYLRLARLAGFDPAPFFVVDSDITGPQGRSLQALQSGVRTVAGGRRSERWRINPYPTAQVDRRSFGELFEKSDGAAAELFDCLFSEEAERTKIRDGMYGRPAIGATCMRLKLQREDQDLRELKEFLKGGEKHVVLVGSCFGGTGSGGVPILAQEFHRLNQEGGYSLRVQALVYLPWFRLELPDGKTAEEYQELHEHLNSNFEPNAAASINYFQRTLHDRLESLVLLGVPDPSSVARSSRESSQEEVVHPLNLLGAVLANNLLSGLQAPVGVSGYWYDAEEGIKAKELEIRRQENGSISLSDSIKRAALQERWLGILARFFREFHRLPKIHRPPFITAALERIRGPRAKPTEVTAEISALLEERARFFREGRDYVDGLGENGLLRIVPEDKRIQSDLYQTKSADPLPSIQEFCNKLDLAGRFDASDVAQPQAFADRFASLYLDDLSRHFNL